ncbi:MAG: T9SS type A sorting domain-containing protein [Hymenobacter sp.]|nr:MAG: T9SS type A sorting domain-containing protein [Hymenobacter sp.]
MGGTATLTAATGLDPDGAGYLWLTRVTVCIQHGGAVETVVRNFEVPQPPANLRIGLAGSTGDDTDMHEVRKLAVKQAPFLRDDDISTGHKVGTMAGQGTTTKATDYSFTDSGAVSYVRPNSPLYYRLRQVDADGMRTYYPVLAVLFNVHQPISCYPNPAGQSVQLNLSALPSSSYQVQVLDLSGRPLAAYSLVGGTAHTLDLKPFVAGLYFVRVVGQSVSQALLRRRE